MLRLYNTALLPLRPAVGLWAWWRSRDPDGRVEWAERRARSLPELPPGGCWIHGSSVGEARIVGGLARAVRAARPSLPLAVSAYTRTGRALLPSPPDVDSAFYLPLDLPALPTRLLRAVRPAALALVETELWPNLLHEAYAQDVPVLVLNGRLSERRMARYRRLSGLYRPLVRRLARVGAQSTEDAERFVALGAPEPAVVVTGNVKYDLPLPDTDAATLRVRLGLSENRPVLVAGSTGPGEEAQVLDAFERVRASVSDLFLVLAPRHLTRVDEVENLLRTRPIRHARWSDSSGRADTVDVVLVDTLGQLAALYQLARIAFVGGSLVPIGGHNLLEPAAVGVPVLYGPHVDNARASAETLERAGGGLRVRDGAELGRALERLLKDDDARDKMAEAGRRVVRSNRGALERSVALLLSVVDTRADAGVA